MEEMNTPEVTPVEEVTSSEMESPPKSGTSSNKKNGRRSTKSTSGKKANTSEKQEVVPEEVTETLDEVTTQEVDAEAQKQAPKKSSRRSANVKALEMEIEKQKELTEEANDRYKRLLAEFENARVREAKEATKMYDIGAKDVLEKLLEVVDNFERALATVPEEDKERAFEKGVDSIYRQLMKALESVGVAPMDACGTQFDPNLHNAVMHVEDETLGENVVAEEMQKGYMYKESVLRHSMVKVAN